MGEAVQKTVAGGLAAAMKNANTKIVELAAANTWSAGVIADNTAAQKEEVKKIKLAAADLKKEALNLIKKEAELGETVNVLERLKNIANDELAGKTKITTDMGKYKVVNANGVSFIQRANLKQELHELLSKTHTASKSLISTLIMMAANDDGHYSDHKIIASNVLKRDNLKTDFAKESAMNQEIIENSAEMVISLKTSTIKTMFSVDLNNKEVLMYNRDIQAIKGAVLRRAGRNTFNMDFCAKQKLMMVT